jgi:hypothetical protein
MNDLKSLLSELCEVELRHRRLNDVAISSNKFTVTMREVEDTITKKKATKIFLTHSAVEEFGVTLKQLASLRVITDKITAKWLHEFEGDPNATILQEKARSMQAAGLGIDSIRLEVVAQLKVRNDFAKLPNTPVYIDKCYTGIAEYSATVRPLMKGESYWETKEYQFGVRDAREKLHATALKEGMDTEKNVVLLPVFKVV